MATDGEVADWVQDDHDEGLQVGRRYAVKMRDCCVDGTFEATLTVIRWGYDDKPRDPEPLTALVFDNGVTLTNWGQVTFSPRPTP